MQKTVSSPAEITQALARMISKEHPKARVRPAAQVAGRMNRTEEVYSRRLTERIAEGEVAGWFFEPQKLRLADATWYTPDFMVLMADGTIEYHEVKACQKNGKVIVEDDAQVKIKVAAEMYPCFTFRRVALWRRKMRQDVWKIETYNTAD